MPRVSRGVVLLPLPRWHDRAILLDSLHGKQTGIARGNRFIAGSILSYQSKAGQSGFDGIFLSHVTCEQMPLSLGHTALGYVHLLLELTNRMVPMGAHAPQLFSLLVCLFVDNHYTRLTDDARVVVLLQLVVLLGFYPGMHVCSQQEIYRLVHMPLADVLVLVLDQTVKASLLCWIRNCITVQMGVPDIKTLGYLPTENHHEC